VGANPWPVIKTEREALADDLEKLTEEQWNTTSLCSNWTVRQVLGHMTATARMSPPKFFVSMVKSGFSFGKMAESDVARETEGSSADTLRRFRELAGSTTHPPGPNDSWLGEAIIHSEDIRRPLGIAHDYPIDALVQVGDFYKGSNLIIGAKKRIAGVKLQSTDADWSTGEGPEAAGPMRAIVMAMTGRKAALDDMSGDGVATLRGRE
jgi:uncharacterized protein (TIGR03083 family)